MSDPNTRSHPVKRRQKDGSTKMVDCPSSIVTYKYMGGVDKGDQLCSYYHVRLKWRNFYKNIFWFVFVAITNSYILSRYAITTTPPPVSRQNLNHYRMQLARQHIGSYSSKVRAGRKRLHPLPLSPSPSDISAARALTDHMPRNSKSSRCHYCTKVRRPLRKESVWYCAACDGQPTLSDWPRRWFRLF